MSNLINVEDLDGTNGLVLAGINEGDRSGASVSDAGDVNGDGYDDVIIGAPFADAGFGNDETGEAYVVFGAPTGFPALASLDDLDGTNGFRIVGVREASSPDDDDPVRLGFSVSAAGDFNDDGFDDVLIGAPDLGTTSAENGAAHLIFGSAERFPAVLTANDFFEGDLDGTNGFTIIGDVDGRFGTQVSAAGDVNGDGFDDFLAMAPSNSLGVNSVALVLGTDEPVPASNFTGSGPQTVFFSRNIIYNFSALATSAAGDINGDGYDDILIGDPKGGVYNPDFIGTGNQSLEPPFTGDAYVIFGSPDPRSMNLETDLDGTNGFKIPGVGEADEFGSDVAPIGDINGDGLDDFMIGAQGNAYIPDDTPGPAIYVIYGTTEGFPAEFDVTSLDGTNGFTIEKAIPEFGELAINPAGDFNADGLADIISGLPAPLTDSVPIRLGDGEVFSVETPGFYSFIGSSVDTAGDFNGDGVDDVIIGADSGGRLEDFGRYDFSGRTYIVFGEPDAGATPLPPLVNNRPISPGIIEDLAGIDPQALTLGPSADAAITFKGELANFENSVGVYRIGEHGELQDPKILFANTEETAAGTTVTLAEIFGPGALEQGDRFGLFSITRGAAKNPASNLDNANGSFEFIDNVTKAPATIETEAPTLVFTQTFGSARQIKGNIFHTSDPDPSQPLTNALNDGGQVQVISKSEPDGTTEIRFEDLVYAKTPSSEDFSDVLLTVDPGEPDLETLVPAPGGGDPAMV